MGLKSLIAVAQGKNAESVSFEDKFLKNYEEAVKAKELEERQVAPSEYIRPSSMYGCERMLFFQRVHGGSQNGEQSEVNLIEICQSGTDRHLDIQHIAERMEGVECLDLEEMVKEAQAKGIKTEFVGWNEDHTEGRCKNDELSIYFQPDGVIRFNGKDVILEIKTESTYQFSNRYEPKADHKWQATCYGMGLGIDYILFFYEDRNFCKKKPYLWKITDEMKQAVLNKIRTVNNACKTGIPPEKDDSKCTYCRYKNECALVDAGKWVHPNPPEKPKTAQKDTNRKKANKSTGKKKKASTGQNTALRAVCGNCEHCGRELGAYYCGIDREGSMYVDRRKKCKFTPSRFSGVAIRFKLFGLETKCIIKERKMEKAIKELVRVLSVPIHVNTGREVDVLNLKVEFSRNVPNNLTEIVDTVTKLDGKVDKETLLSLLPFIDNPKEVLEKLEADKERDRQNTDPYSTQNITEDSNYLFPNLNAQNSRQEALNAQGATIPQPEQ